MAHSVGGSDSYPSTGAPSWAASGLFPARSVGRVFENGSSFEWHSFSVTTAVVS